ncbi:MAG TPA: HAD family hydrolase [Gemmatimonadales bacterium]|nr:HAD family hydrolase [Gemmatimonadales bacterium]
MNHSRQWARWRGIAAGAMLLGTALPLSAQSNPLPSWNNGAAKASIIEFVEATTTKGSPEFVPVAERIATFDNDGTLWVEHPVYTQVEFVLGRVPAVVKEKPALAAEEPFKTVMSGDRAAISKLGMEDLMKLLAATSTGMTVEQFQSEAKAWFASARDPRWKKPYPDLAYQPMVELLRYLRANGYKTYIVTGGGQDFVRTISEQAYGIPPEQVIGTAGTTTYGHDSTGKAVLTKNPKVMLNDNNEGKAEGIQLMIGRRPHFAFGNTSGDQQMLEYTGTGDGARLSMLLLHDDATREYAYGPARGLPDTKVGTFSVALDSIAKARGWTVVSMKKDWKRVFAFE